MRSLDTNLDNMSSFDRQLCRIKSLTDIYLRHLFIYVVFVTVSDASFQSYTYFIQRYRNDNKISILILLGKGSTFQNHPTVQGSSITRQYSILSLPDETGYFSLLIKLYPTGQMSSVMREFVVLITLIFSFIRNEQQIVLKPNLILICISKIFETAFKTGVLILYNQFYL